MSIRILMKNEDLTPSLFIPGKSTRQFGLPPHSRQSLPTVVPSCVAGMDPLRKFVHKQGDYNTSHPDSGIYPCKQ